MPELLLIRHAQASFGAADYDVLSDLGHAQSRALGEALRRQGVRPVAVYRGAMRRHRETLEGIATALDLPEATVHEGLNEFDSKALLAALGGGVPSDRKAHFRRLREAVIAWQAGEITEPESFTDFTARVMSAQAQMATHDGPVLCVSSGGAICRMLAAAVDAPARTMIDLQLQMKNCAVSRILCTGSATFLTGFNETPHIDAEAAHMLTFS
ncbi:histidine phosphatase family protein [Vannielia litorea]|uniref:histidine phosphatase family protein n=1 Tax=Vannielia litorea TaxID=1217970 RepID=UPI001C941FE9|nr:histidine phosphatase family protein [Vannielia litorea]MBY6152241.1 histidine phosphatase family protein [Vannielia litorea]